MSAAARSRSSHHEQRVSARQGFLDFRRRDELGSPGLEPAGFDRKPSPRGNNVPRRYGLSLLAASRGRLAAA
jgi:hypothetical protein